MKGKNKMVLLGIVLFCVVFIISLFAFVIFAPQLGAKSDKDILMRMEKAPNYKNGKFFNLTETSMKFDFEWDKMKSFFDDTDRKPIEPLPIDKININDLYNQNISQHQDKIKIWWLGHSSVLMKINQKIILIDPVFSSRASIVSFAGPKRFSELKPIELENFKKIDIVLISHDHYDHLDYKTIKRIKDITNQFIVPLGVGAHLNRWGVEKKKIKELYWHESTEYEGIKFISTPARHFSGRGLFNRNSTLWSSWVVTNGVKNIFYSGDSGFDSTISKQIGDNYGPFDLTFMECGQYNEQWQHIHSFPEKAVEAQQLLKGKVLLPIHWGMFKLSLHTWKEPIERLLRSANINNIMVTTPKLGEEIIIDSLYPNARWWENNK